MNNTATEESEDLIDDIDTGSESGEQGLVFHAIYERNGVKQLMADIEGNYGNVTIYSYHHSEDFKSTLKNSDIILFECRIIGIFSDLQSIREIRNARPFVPIIVISENQDSEMKLMAFQEGVNDYVPLSVSKEELVARLKSFQRISQSAKMVEVQNDQLVTTMKSLREANNELRQESTSRIVAEAERDVAEEVSRIHKQNKEILDNLRSGFFTVKSDLVVGKTTSKACDDLFAGEIAEKKIGNILNLNNGKEEHVQMVLEQLFENILPIEVNISLLPKQMETKGDKIIEFHYTPVCDDKGEPVKLIIVATDVTESVLAQREMMKKEALNRALINILNNFESFSTFISSFKEELAFLKTSSNVDDLKRGLHTLKGNSSIFNLDSIFNRIHDMESDLLNLESDEEICKKVQEYACELEEMMRQFILDNKSVLQMEFDKEQVEQFKFNKAQIEDLYSLIESLPEANQEKFTSILDQHKLVPISLFTAIYQNTVSKLMDKLGKKIKFEVIGHDLRIEKKSYDNIFKNLIHAISNACDHGIEPPMEREEKKKLEEGSLELRFERTLNKELNIYVKDDGRGINKDRLLELALTNGHITEQERDSMGEQDVLGLIFHDGLSTARQVSNVSGRGVGMAALKQAVEEKQGQILISSEEDKGSTIKIVLANVFQ